MSAPDTSGDFLRGLIVLGAPVVGGDGAVVASAVDAHAMNWLDRVEAMVVVRIVGWSIVAVVAIGAAFLVLWWLR